MANQKPIDEVRIGRVKATIWKNGTEDAPRYNVIFSSLYKDGDKWQNTQSFGRNDLLTLAKVADLAHSRIFELPQEEEQRTGGRFLAGKSRAAEPAPAALRSFGKENMNYELPTLRRGGPPDSRL